MGMITYIQPVRGGEAVGDEVDIDKSCYYLAEGLDALGLDGNAVVTGHEVVDDESDGDSGFYEGWLDPEKVQGYWQRLRVITFERFLAALRETPLGAGDDQDDDCLEAHFLSLVEVYRKAADAGAGIKTTAC